MLPTIHFDDTTFFAANKVTDVAEYRDLSRKLVSVDLPVANAIPEDRFRVGLVGPQSSCDSDGLFVAATHCLAPHPDRISDAIRPLPAKERGEV
jgi:hypothetical protein